jgi:hypothetical protein
MEEAELNGACSTHGVMRYNLYKKCSMKTGREKTILKSGCMEENNIK